MGISSVIKPKLLLNAGYPSSGTTSLYYTLWKNKYGHGGGVKESNYLLHVQSPQIEKDREKLHQRKISYGKGVYRPWSLPDKVFTNHSFDHKNVSINKYIDYNLKLWEDIKGEYKSILDFSNSEHQLTEKFMMSIKDELLKNFNIKIVMMLRDPIRRLWSHCNRKSISEEGTPQSHMKFDDPNLNYIEKYQRYVRVWGKDNVKVIISEEFYTGHTQPLSDFLGYNIKPFYNDINHLWKMKDDMFSNWCKLDQETWEHAYENMKWIYDEWHPMPVQWGRHSIL